MEGCAKGHDSIGFCAVFYLPPPNVLEVLEQQSLKNAQCESCEISHFYQMGGLCS